MHKLLHQLEKRNKHYETMCPGVKHLSIGAWPVFFFLLKYIYIYISIVVFCCGAEVSDFCGIQLANEVISNGTSSIAPDQGQGRHVAHVRFRRSFSIGTGFVSRFGD